MTRVFLAVCAMLTLAGCFGYTEKTTPSQDHTVIVVPPGSNLVCANGSRPPC